MNKNIKTWQERQPASARQLGTAASQVGYMQAQIDEQAAYITELEARQPEGQSPAETCEPTQSIDTEEFWSLVVEHHSGYQYGPVSRVDAAKQAIVEHVQEFAARCTPAAPESPTPMMPAVLEMIAAADAFFASPAAPVVATVIKKGADRQWMSEALGSLPDGTYSLSLAGAAPVVAEGLIDLDAIRLIADELEIEAENYDGDFADTVKGCAAALLHLLAAHNTEGVTPVAGSPAEANQCDGCQSGAPIRNGLHVDAVTSRAYMSCQKSKYDAAEPMPADTELVPGLMTPTTYADIARITPEQLFRRWLGDRSEAVITAREAFFGGRAVPRAAEPTPASEAPEKACGLCDDDISILVMGIQQLEALASGTINALGSDNLLKPSKKKRATMADTKRILPYIVGNLRALHRKLDGGGRPTAVMAGGPPMPSSLSSLRSDSKAASYLYSTIMSLPSVYQSEPGDDYATGYSTGHRDALYAAAELVLARLAAPAAPTDAKPVARISWNNAYFEWRLEMLCEPVGMDTIDLFMWAPDAQSVRDAAQLATDAEIVELIRMSESASMDTLRKGMKMAISALAEIAAQPTTAPGEIA